MQKILPDLFIQPLFDDNTVAINFKIPAGCRCCSWQIIFNKEVVNEGKTELVPLKTAKIFEQIKNFVPWSLDNPNLYELKLTLTIDGKLYEITEYFGMRKIEARGKWVYLNNEKIYLRGHIRGREAHDHPNLLNLSPTEFYKKNIRQAKKFGFNLVRFHSRIPEKAFLEAADKLGFLVHVELRKYFGKYQKERRMMSDEGELLGRQQWIDTILKLRNHPSVIVYCMGNEIRKPGRNPFVEEIAGLTKEIDPTRFFIDTCAHGEYDRTYVDFDVQHMSYYFPYGENYDMFDNTYNWHIYGSCKGRELVKQTCDHEIKRALKVDRPVLAHEICHYIALHDIYKLDEKFIACGAEKPWWIDELKRLIELKGFKNSYDRLYKASKEFQQQCWKLGIEATRRSNLLAGFHFLQLADTDLYENSNGLIDCFDDDRYVKEGFFKQFNSDTVLLADLPQRTFFESQMCKVPVLVSHFDAKLKGLAEFSFELIDDQGKLWYSDYLQDVDMTELGLTEICEVGLKFPEIGKPSSLTFKVKLTFTDKTEVVNSWNLWSYPNCPQSVAHIRAKLDTPQLDISRRYPQLNSQDSNLLIKNRFDDEVFEHLENGGDVAILYRATETRARNQPAQKEKYYLPSTWDRYKGIIWDRGTFSGGFTNEHFITEQFENNGFLDLQFHDLIDDCDKINLDSFPIKDIEPIIQGVDKAVRDRFDVYTYSLSELQPDWTLRKFAYMFELKVGKGRLFVSGFNFTGIADNKPEVCFMFETILKYAASDKFAPKASISVDDLKEYLEQQGAKPRMPERKMTQFWQLNNMPLETDQYWKQAEEFIAAQTKES